MDDERKHPATPNRLARAARDGECFHSAQLSIVVLTAVAVVIVVAGVSWLTSGIVEWTTACWRTPLQQPNQVAASGLIDRDFAWRVAFPVATGLALLWATAWLVYVAQTGWVWGRKPIWSLAFWSPASRWSQSFGMRRIGSNLLGVLQAAIVLGLLGWIAYAQRDAVLALWWTPPAGWGRQCLLIVQTWLAPLLLAMLGLAVLDYLWQRTMFRRSLRMTDQELRDELRDAQRATGKPYQ